MADLLEQIEPTLISLKQALTRATELEARVVATRARVQADESQFQSKSQDLVPRAQAVVAKLTATQNSIEQSFSRMIGQVKSFRGNLVALHTNAIKQSNSMLDGITSLQTEHDNLKHETDTLRAGSKKIVFQHGTAAQDNLQKIAPQVEGVESLLRDNVIPGSSKLGDQVVQMVKKAGLEVHENVIPGLLQTANSLNAKLDTGAQEIQEKARALAAEIDRQTQELMKQAIEAAKKIEANSQSRILGLVGEIKLNIDSITLLIVNLNGARRGLHAGKKQALSALGTLASIIDDLRLLVRKLEEGSSQ